MSSAKMFLCDACLIILVGLAFALPEDKTVGNKAVIEEVVKGNCSCGGFGSSSPGAGQAPLLAHSPGLAVECTPAGNATCRSLCVALATATGAKGPEILCNRLKDCDELKLSVFYKICDGPWAFANMTAEEPLCCENSKPKKCSSAKQVLVTGTTEVNAPTATTTTTPTTTTAVA